MQSKLVGLVQQPLVALQHRHQRQTNSWLILMMTMTMMKAAMVVVGQRLQHPPSGRQALTLWLCSSNNSNNNSRHQFVVDG